MGVILPPSRKFQTCGKVVAKNLNMTAEITTMIGQLNIVGGTWQSNALNQVAVREPKSADSPGKGKGDLFVLTDVLGSTTDTQKLEQRLAEIVRDVYYLARGSVTASLRRAMQTANDYLYQYNAKIDVDDRVVGGVVVMVMCQEDVFVAQIGPATVYAVSGEEVKRYPATSIWLDDKSIDEDNDELALGISPLIEPNLYHIQVNPQDVLVLADSDLVSQLSPADVAQAVMLQNIRTVIKNLGKAANSDCSALALTVVEESHSMFNGFNGLNIPTSTHLYKLLPNREPELEPNQSEEFPVSASATAPGPLTKLAENSLNWLKSAMPANNVDIDDTVKKNADKYAPRPPLQPTHVMASTSPTPVFQPELQKEQSGMQVIVQGISSMLLMLIAALAGGFRTILGFISTGETEHYPRQAGRQAQPSTGNLITWKALLGLAIAIPVVVVSIVGISYLRDQRLQETEYSTLITTAQGKIEQAGSIDGGSALMLMAEAENLLIQAEQLKTGQPEVSAMRQQIATKIDSISKVERFQHLPHLRSYIDTNTNLKSILVQGNELYVMDVGTNRLFHHQLDTSGDGLLPDDNTSLILVQQGQVVDDITVGNLSDIVWMPSGGNRQTSDLLVLGSTGLLEYNPNWGITTASLANLSQLVSPVAAKSFFGNFYILDAKGNQILRYLPTADGYGAIPESYFPPNQQIDLTQSVDFAIDGSIYVLFLDGRIGKYASGQPVEFNITGLDKPLKLPTTIYTAPDEVVQHIYVADAGNQRIVQLNKDGSFVRQFKPNVGEAVTFANLQDIYVDEISQRIYILDSNNLYMGQLGN
jgi:serine/threonine protein phosphatase PrpC